MFLRFIQLSEEITGHVPTDDKSIEKESSWIYKKLTASDMPPFFGNMDLIGEINQNDIGNVLGMLHVQKLDVRRHTFFSFFFCLYYMRGMVNYPSPNLP